MRRALFCLMLFIALPDLAPAAEAWQGRVLHACEDEEGYPPFTFPGADGKAQGFSVDLIEEALAGTGMRLEVAFLPPVRCNSALDDARMDMSMEGFWDPDMAQRWRATDSIYDGTYVLYYDRTRYPNGVVLADVLAHPELHHGCGLLGAVHNDFARDQIIGHEYLYAEVLGQVLRGQCEFFPNLLEFGAAYRLNGRRLLADGRFVYVPYPLRDRPARVQRYDPGDKQPLYFYLRPDFPDGEALIARINETVARWRGTGKQAEVLARYVDLAAFARPSVAADGR